jgi:hypothetical protein
MKRGIGNVTSSLLSSGLAWMYLCLIHPAPAIAQHQPATPGKPKSTVLTWNPPQVDWRLKSHIPDPPCILPSALKKASERADTIFENLKSFVAREDIRFQTMAYRASDQQDMVLNEFARAYDYIVFFKETPDGFVAQDSRKPLGGSSLQPAFDQDLGLTEMALIFLSGMQADYEFKCEGTVTWNEQPAWVIRFQQRKDRPHRTISFRGENGASAASLRGRAWIAADSGEIQHMEARLVDALPEINVRQWYFSINYAPVAFATKNVRMSLPQTADVYVEFEGNRRTITSHTFSDFRLFSATVTMRP